MIINKRLVKKIYHPILWLVFLTIAISPGLASLSKPGFYHTHDGELHLGRFAATYKAFKYGQIIPRWAANINFGYGHPVLIFQYPLANWLASPFLVAGFSLQATFKLLIFFSSLASVIFMFLFLKTMFKARTAFLGALIYFYLPYRFLDIYLRGSIGEIMAFAFLPATFWAMSKLVKRTNFRNLTILSFSLSLLILSHHGLAFISSFFLTIFGFFLIWQGSVKKLKKIKYLALAAILGLGLSTFFWFPFLTEIKFTKYEEAVGQKYSQHFVYPEQLIIPSWGYGISEPGRGDTMSFQLGIVQLIMVSLSLSVLPLLPGKKRQLYILLLFSLLLFIFLTLPYSQFFWKVFPLLSRLQFPWRFLFLIGFTAPIIVSFFLDRVDSKIFHSFLFLVLLACNFQYWKPDIYYPLNEKVFDNYPHNTTWFDENNPIWQKAPLTSFATSQFETSRPAKISVVKIKGQKHLAWVESTQEITLTDNTLYFPGWEAKIDGKKALVSPSKPQGLIQISVPAGKHKVEISFKETIARQIANLVSLTSLVILLGIGLKKKVSRD